MTSKAGTFVFVQLPGSVSPVVAARYELEPTEPARLEELLSPIVERAQASFAPRA